MRFFERILDSRVFDSGWFWGIFYGSIAFLFCEFACYYGIS